MLFKIFFPKAHPTQNVHPHLAKRTVVQGFYLWQTFLINYSNSNRVEKRWLRLGSTVFYARTYLQTDKKQAYRSETPLLSEENLKTGALDSNFALRNKVEKVESVMPWVASVKTLAARPSSKREVHTKIPNSKL